GVGRLPRSTHRGLWRDVGRPLRWFNRQQSGAENGREEQHGGGSIVGRPADRGSGGPNLRGVPYARRTALMAPFVDRPVAVVVDGVATDLGGPGVGGGVAVVAVFAPAEAVTV